MERLGSTHFCRNWSILLLTMLCATSAHAQGDRTSSSEDMPALAAQKIDEYHEAGKDVGVMAFAPNGEWVLVADDYRYYSSVSYFDANGLRPKLEEYRDAGKEIDAVAIAPGGEWVLVADDYRYYSSVSYFDDIGLRDQIEILLRDGIDDVEIGPDGGWVVVSGGRAFFNGTLPDEMKKALRDARVGKRNVQEVALDNARWFVSAGEWFQHGDLGARNRAALADFRDEGQRVDLLALAPGGGWSVISNGLFTDVDDAVGFDFENDLDSSGLNIYERMDYHNVPGASIAVTSNRGLVWARTYGVRASGTDHFVHADTRFPAASMSKAVGAAAVQRLVQEGRIDDTANVMDLEDQYPNTDFDQWVERIGEQDLASYIPAPALIKVIEYYQRGKEIDVIALAPGNHWLVVADDYRYYSNVSYFDDNDLRPKLEEYRDAGKEIDVVAIAPNGEWVIVADDYRYYSNVSYFDDIGLRPKLEEYRDTGLEIDAITLMNGAEWAMVADDSTAYSSNFDDNSLRDWIEAPLRYGIDEIIVTADDAWKVFSNWMFEPEFTVHDLLGHTAGLSRHGIGLYPRDGALPFWQRPEAVPSLGEVLMGEGPVAGENVRLLAPPQTVWDYSGGGFSAAEALVEAITDESFAEHADEDVLRALGMTESTFQDLPISLAGEFAQGHRANLDPLPIRTCPGKMAGGLNTTASDYAKFVRMLMRGGLDEHDRPFLSSDLAEAMLTSRKDDSGMFFPNANDTPNLQAYGLGVDVVDATGRFFHGGTQDGYKLYFSSCSNPADSLGLVIMANGKDAWTAADSTDRGAWELIKEVRRSFFSMCTTYTPPVAGSDDPGEAGPGSLRLRGRSAARASSSASLNISGDAVTVEAWVKHDGNSDENAVIVSNHDGRGYGLRFEGSGEEVPIAFGVRLPFHNDSYVAVSDVGVPAGRWTHVAGTFDGATLRVYVDGELSGTREQSGDIGASTAPLAIGASTSATEHILRGYVDEVRIWNAVRTSAEIAGDRFEVLDAAEPGLAAYYRFGERDPNADLSRNANDLNFIGPASHLLPDVFPAPPAVYAARNAAEPDAAIDVQWSGPEQDVESYRLYRQAGVDGEQRELVRELEAQCVFTPCEYADRDVTPGQVYAYYVTTVAPDGTEGDFSPLALATPSSDRHGGVLRLQGDGHAKVSYRPTLDIAGENVTVEAWIKHDGTSDEDAVIVSNQDGRGYGLRLEGSGEEVPVAFGAWLSIFTDSYAAISDVGVPAGRWTHVAGTHDGTTLRVYVDGALSGTDDRDHAIGSSTAPLVIGARVDGSDNDFHGDIDDVRLWNRTLSATELEVDPSTTLLGDEEGLAALFRFDEGDGDVFYGSTAWPMTGALAGSATLVSSTSTAAEPLASDVPKTFQLDGNYPNPFAGRTTIRYGLPRATPVRLTVYDVLGRRVALLADGSQPAGWHEAIFEAEALPAGLYLYRLEAGDRTAHGRMLNVR